jgi:hypothetical protein
VKTLPYLKLMDEPSVAAKSTQSPAIMILVFSQMMVSFLLQGFPIYCPLDASPETVVLTIWKNGKVRLQIKLGQVLKSLKSLRRTASHYAWRENMGFAYNDRFWIKTVEGKTVYINPEDGKIEFASH